MDNLVLINKTRGISEFYIPKDLVCCDDNENNFHEYLNPNLKPMVLKEAFDHFDDLKTDAFLEGFDFLVDSGFRTYLYQREIWIERYYKYFQELKKVNPTMRLDDLKVHAERLTNGYVARPGHSEHQTGLAIDIATLVNGKCVEVKEGSKEYDWLYDNSYLYGFILRYPKGKEDITGYNFEPWHYRYVGIPYSEEIKKDNLTLEEYHEMVLRKK